MIKVIERHQISIFFILAFVLSWYPWYAGIAADVLIIGPSLAAFIVVLIVTRKRGFIDLLRPFIRLRAGLLWWGIALFGMAGIFLIGLGAHLVLGGEAPPFIMIREELNLIPLY